MHGVIFYTFEQYVRQRHGEPAWRSLLEGSPFASIAFVPTGTYPDAELLRLVGALVERTGISAERVQEELGEFMVPGLVGMYGAFIDSRWRALDLIEHTEETIHKVVRMRDRDARPPSLDCRRVAGDRLTLVYSSPRRLCAVARGIVRGVGRHYGEQLEIAETRCMHRGDASCELEIKAAAVRVGVAA